MKILQVVHSFVPYTMAGTEVYTYKLSRELSKKNDISIFFRVNNTQRKEYSLTQNTFEGMQNYSINHTFRCCYSFEDTYNDSVIDKKFGELLDEVKPDVIHIHHLLFLSHGIIREIKNRHIPVVYTLHDYWLICYRGQLIKGDFTICGGDSVLECKDCLRYALNIKKYAVYLYMILRKISPPAIFGLFKRFYFLLEGAGPLIKVERLRNSLKEICEQIDLFIAPSHFIRNKFIQHSIPESKILYSKHGFDYKSFDFITKSKSSVLRFGYLGTLLPMKGVDILISAFIEAININIKLSIYGRLFSYRGFESYPKALRKKASADNRINFMGGYDNRDVGRILSNMDVLIVPSIWPENAPLVIQEALISKTPVIASRIGGIPELIKDGENGLLFNPADVNDLKNKIEYIIDNPAALERFRKNMPEVKNIKDNAEELEAIYSKLVNNKRLLNKEAGLRI